MHLFQLALITAVIFLLLDALWLGVVAKQLYADKLAGLLRPKPHLGAAVAFYALYIVGVTYFVLSWPTSALTAAGAGALFGLVAYGTYDLTNAATLKNWPWLIVALDLAWGAFATGVAAGLGYAIAGWL